MNRETQELIIALTDRAFPLDWDCVRIIKDLVEEKKHLLKIIHNQKARIKELKRL